MFIAAAIICRFLHETKFPKKRLQSLLSVTRHTTSNGMTKEIDDMYLTILEQALTDNPDNEVLKPLYRPVMGWIILSFERLSIADIAIMVSESVDYIKILLNELQSVIVASEFSVDIFHLSFHDFLINHDRCNHKDFYIDEKQTHGDMFQTCIHILSHSLKKDICGVKKPGILVSEVNPGLIKQHIPQRLRYASCHWANHLQAAVFCPTKATVLHDFLKTHLLHWLETLAWIERIGDAVTAFNTLHALIVSPKQKPLKI